MQCDKCGNVTIHANDLTKNIGTIRASPTPRHTHTVTLHSTIQCQWLYTALLSVYTQCIEIKHTHTHTRVSDSAQHNTVYTQIKHVCQWLYTVSIHSVFKQNTHTNTCQWLDLHNSTQCLYTNKTHTYVSVSTQTNTRMWRYVSVSTHTRTPATTRRVYPRSWRHKPRDHGAHSRPQHLVVWLRVVWLLHFTAEIVRKTWATQSRFVTPKSNTHRLVSDTCFTFECRWVWTTFVSTDGWRWRQTTLWRSAHFCCDREIFYNN